MPGFALLLAVVDTSVFISGHGVIRRLVEAMEAADDPVRSRDAPPFQLRVQLVVPFQASRPPLNVPQSPIELFSGPKPDPVSYILLLIVGASQSRASLSL